MMSHPVFLLASERSGTNLLRMRLQESQSDLLCPAPIHMLKILHGAVPYYGDLQKEERFQEFIKAGLGLCREHFAPWDTEITVDDVLDEFHHSNNSRNAVNLMDVIYTLHAREKGFCSYLCKDNNLFDFAPEIESSLPDARFIYLSRDPRDFVVSQRKRPTQTSSIIRLAEMWQDEQARALAFVANSPQRQNIYCMTYESLISNENAEIDRLLEFLGTERTSGSGTSTSNTPDVIHEWKNLSKRTLQHNKQKYRGELSRRQIRQIEAITWNPMKFLGYRPESVQRPSASATYRSFERIAYQALDFFKRWRASKLLTGGQRRMNRYTSALMRLWQ